VGGKSRAAGSDDAVGSDLFDCHLHISALKSLCFGIRESGLGIRDSGLGTRESGIGNRD